MGKAKRYKNCNRTMPRRKANLPLAERLGRESTRTGKSKHKKKKRKGGYQKMPTHQSN